MYLTGLLMYLICPAFIILSWYAVKFAVDLYEKKFPEEE